MKLVLCSDLHLEFKLARVPQLGSNSTNTNNLEEVGQGSILALLGDIGKPGLDTKSYENFIEKCVTEYKFDKVLIILGNHEFYGGEYYERKKEIKKIANLYPDKVYLMDRDSMLIEEPQLGKKIRILGCTLWSQVPSRFERDISRAINDYKLISIKDKQEAPPRLLTVEDTNRFYKEDVEWLKEQLELAKENNETQVVVLTHHAPLTLGTSHPKHDSSLYSYAFSTHLESIIKDNPLVKVWGYGHTHYSNSVQCHQALVVSNQLGYRMEVDNVNGFNPNFSLDI